MIWNSIKNCSMISWCVAYKCQKTKDKSSNQVAYQEMEKIAKIWQNRINRTDFSKIIALCEKDFEESWFDKSISMLLCLLGEVVSWLFYSKQPTEVN